MFKVEMLIDGAWVTSSSHTQPVDAEAQRQRRIADGVDEATLRIVEVADE